MKQGIQRVKNCSLLCPDKMLYQRVAVKSPTVHVARAALHGQCLKCTLSRKDVTGLKPSLVCAVLVDGAHAVGAIPLDVPSLGVQFYTSNLHKWGCCPKSAAFLWVQKDLQSSTVPLVTSHGYKTVHCHKGSTI